MGPEELYKRKLKSIDEVVKLVQPGMWIGIGNLSCVAWLFDRALAERCSELSDVKLWLEFPVRPLKCLEADKDGKVFSVYSGFLGEGMRNRSNVHYLPSQLGLLPHMFREGLLKVDIAIKTVTPMDRRGYFNFSVDITYAKAMFESAKIKIVEVNESAPWVSGGYDECIHISEVDYIIENHEDKIPELPPREPSEIEKRIAENIINVLPRPLEALTLQVGVGGVPDAFCKMLEEVGARDLGVHSEMLSEGMFRLAEAGIITGRRKSFLPGKMVHSFAFGSREMYNWLDHNPAVAGYPADFVNDPFIISLNNNIVSINSAIEVDLTGQVNAESIGPMMYSGVGGQMAWTYAVSSYRSSKGMPNLGWSSKNFSFIVLPSTYYDKKSGKTFSRIVPTLRPGGGVTTQRSNVMYIVTEYGAAQLKGKSVRERALELIKIAHPDFRDQITEEATKLGYI
ncbi:MAG: acetyl-CoA hydrolase/transferase C-terminal domain-containing protein [Candidatus Bathyarchaeia archaeon]